MEGYVNIDHPPTEHTVQSSLKADRYADIIQLEYPRSSVEEIRLHHVFEHFPRQTALALLCRWNDWLVPGGLLWIETPDVMTSALALVSPFTKDGTRQQIMRHLFGSHEAAWAAHWDGWYKEKFSMTLQELGFSKLNFKQSRWGALCNIDVKARKGTKTYTLEDYRVIARSLLVKSLITHKTKESSRAIADSEEKMLDLWMKEWEASYLGQHAGIGSGGIVRAG